MTKNQMESSWRLRGGGKKKTQTKTKQRQGQGQGRLPRKKVGFEFIIVEFMILMASAVC